ncbi:MAG TPA: NADH-quinone oxidoreductase subunit L [Chloroflexota bacterium]|nr:NADH-quinone oxidoreductase subunit L [Chloroflexota bacterium]
MPAYLWLVPVLPVIGLILIIVSGRYRPRWSGYLAVAAIGLSFLLAFLALGELIGQGTAGTVSRVETFDWFRVGSISLQLGLIFDPLAAAMLVLVAFISLVVQIYSLGYMAGDPGYTRYFAFMCIFTAAMLGLVLAPNFLQLYIFWELVGLSSYLLIGFWYERPAAAAAAVKAFVTTRLGDLGLLTGILILYSRTGSFDFSQIAAAVRAGNLGTGLLTLAMLLVFLGAVGKSAQFPLHVWLPDAMEGPTPVSALIHAATMVAAGVYLIARTFPLFAASAAAMQVVAWIGGFTALFAATQGLVMTDIKRVLAYSTISQLGYMMLGLGAASLAAGMFHLITHAFFKALLFLAAGAVIHQLGGEQNLLAMGGLFRRMPVTALTFLCGALALAAIPPFSGFWSKDEVIAAVERSGNLALTLLALATSALTAFYIFRAWFLAFLGQPRGALPAGWGRDHAPGHGPGTHRPDAGEASPVLVAPLVILAVLAVGAGLVGSPLFGGAFAAFITGSAEVSPGLDPGLAFLSTAISLVGILLAWAYYGAGWLSAEATARAVRPVYILLVKRYYLDDLYAWLVRRVLLGLSSLLAWFDRQIIDGAVNGLAWLCYAVFGWALTRLQTGRTPSYALGFVVGVVVIVLVAIVFPPAR